MVPWVGRQRTSFSQLQGPVASSLPKDEHRRQEGSGRDPGALHESSVGRALDGMAAVGKCGGWSGEVQRRQATRKKGRKRRSFLT